MGPIDAACTLCKQQKRKCSLMSTLSLLGTLVGHREAQKDPLYVFSQPSQSTILNTYADVIRKRDLTTRRMLDVDSAKESDGDARRVKRAKTQSGAPSGANLKGGQVKENPQYQYVGAFPFFASIPFCADVQLLTPLLISVHPKPLSNLLGTPNSEHCSTSVSRSRAKAPHMVPENNSNTSVLGPFQLPSFSRLSDDLTGREATRTAFTTGQSNAIHQARCDVMCSSILRPHVRIRKIKQLHLFQREGNMDSSRYQALSSPTHRPRIGSTGTLTLSTSTPTVA